MHVLRFENCGFNQEIFCVTGWSIKHRQRLINVFLIHLQCLPETLMWLELLLILYSWHARNIAYDFLIFSDANKKPSFGNGWCIILHTQDKQRGNTLCPKWQTAAILQMSNLTRVGENQGMAKSKDQHITDIGNGRQVSPIGSAFSFPCATSRIYEITSIYFCKLHSIDVHTWCANITLLLCDSDT